MKSPEDSARKFSRIAKERHLDLNKSMREQLCAPETPKKKASTKKIKRTKKNSKKK